MAEPQERLAVLVEDRECLRELAEVGRRPTEVVTHLQRHELEPGTREQVVRLVEVGDRLTQLTAAHADPTPIHEDACQIDRRTPLAEVRDRLGDDLERLVDPSRPRVQRGTLETPGLPLRFRSEPFDIVEMRERGRHRRSEGEHSRQRQMGVGCGLGVADLLRRGNRSVEGRRRQVDLAEQAAGPPEDGQPPADTELIAIRPALVDESGRLDRDACRIALEQRCELGERGEPVRCDPGSGDAATLRPADTT